MAKTFAAGDKVFAKVRGHPPWPARVVGVADTIENKPKYNVVFYGTFEVGACKEEDLYPYAQNKEKYGKPMKRRIFNEALAQIEGHAPVPQLDGEKPPSPMQKSTKRERAVPRDPLTLSALASPEAGPSTPYKPVIIHHSGLKTRKLSFTDEDSEGGNLSPDAMPLLGGGRGGTKRSRSPVAGDSEDGEKPPSPMQKRTKRERAVPRDPLTLSALASPEAGPSTPYKPVIVHQSGQKIKKVTFADEDFEGGNLSPDAMPLLGGGRGGTKRSRSPVAGDSEDGEKPPSPMQKRTKRERAVPRDPLTLSALASPEAGPSTPYKPVIVHQSGQKIKKVTFADEDFEGGNLSPDAMPLLGAGRSGTKQPRSPVAGDSESEQEPARCESVVVANAAQLEEQTKNRVPLPASIQFQLNKQNKELKDIIDKKRQPQLQTFGSIASSEFHHLFGYHSLGVSLAIAFILLAQIIVGLYILNYLLL